VSSEDLSPKHIIPSVFDPAVAESVARASADAARADGVCR
jgi:malate dehydrogenase (oxaloacetate-decarboxylating)